MATYPGMTLGGEVRESVSLDEDDLSDVEDEVFIRDGKNGYKFVEDAGVKRPLMAPRRKLGKPDITSRLRGRPPCKALCKPCCYVFSALFVLIGLIVLVVILVSLFPLPLDKIKYWIVSKTSDNVTVKILPCTDLKVTDVWTVSLPKFVSESPIRAIDINNDGVEDLIFGFGTAIENTLHQKLFCPIFMGVSPPCEGGVIALNGTNGATLWRKWFMNPIFSVICNVDINDDGVADCLVSGKEGILSTLDAKTGIVLWQFDDIFKSDVNLRLDIYTAGYIPDQNNDGILDLIASHTAENEKDVMGHLILISGKDGKTIKKFDIPGVKEIYYTPQIFNSSQGELLVLFGTGSPISPGNLSIIPFKNLVSGNMTYTTIYEDKFKGIVSPSVIVDITGDGQVDIIMGSLNSTIVAIDGATFKQLWNFTIPNSESLSIPIPGYFNNDNITDFFVKYQTGEFPAYFYSQAYIINGKTGKPIYKDPIVDTLGSQIGGLTLGMEEYGFDLYLYWIVNCVGIEETKTGFQFYPGSTIRQQSNSDLCKLRFNSTATASLYALNQYDQPPGFEVYNSVNRSELEFKNIRTAIEEATEYFKLHPENDFQTDDTEEVVEMLSNSNPPLPNEYTLKYPERTTFRHKSNRPDLVKNFESDNKNKMIDPLKTMGSFNDNIDYDQDQQADWNSQTGQFNINDPTGQIYDIVPYLSDPLYNQNNQYLVDTNQKLPSRDPRSKIGQNFDKTMEESTSTYPSTTDSSHFDSNNKKGKTLKKNLADMPFGIYSYKNVKMARNRLLHDLNSSPKEILADNYFKTKERQLKKSRFEERDLESHRDKTREKEVIKKIIEGEKEAILNVSESLWDIESEKEAEDRANGYWRSKRNSNISINWIPKITSMGVLLNAIGPQQNAIDLVFLTYWLPPKEGAHIVLEQDVKCVTEKIQAAINSKDNMAKIDLKETFESECLKKRLSAKVTKTTTKSSVKSKLPYYQQISQLRMGQMTVYRVRIECQCITLKKGERCAKFLNSNYQRWPAYLGNNGDGFVRIF